MSEHEIEIIPPKASALLESLRSFGYSLTDAIADLIDNSITAEATIVNVDFRWSGGNSSIVISDNGNGMSYDELVEAMSLGVNGPLVQRENKDLGRFGLGLKTASLSQASIMKVYSSTDGESIHGLSWDLKFVSKDDKWANQWAAKKLNNQSFLEEKIKKLSKGTVIVLECLDRIVNLNSKEDSLDERTDFYELIAKVQSNLGVIFHRFIQEKRLKIIFNSNTDVIAYDPLHLDKEETKILWKNEIVKADILKTRVTSVLISKDILEDEQNKNIEILSRQGVFIYRNDRIVSWGKWLGLSSVNNHDHRYFRSSIEFNSEDDQSWNIDVKKTNVNIPKPLSKKLKPLIKAGLSRSREMVWNNTFLKKDPNRVIQPLWISASRKGRNILIINREFPILKKISSKTESRKDLELFLKIIESSLTIHDMSQDLENESDKKTFLEDNLQELGLDPSEIESFLQSIKINQG